MPAPKPDASRPVIPCTSCGQRHMREATGLRTCKAHRKDGQPCTQYPVGGTTLGKVCKNHGGTTRLAKHGVAKRSRQRQQNAYEDIIVAAVWRQIKANPQEPLKVNLTPTQEKALRRKVNAHNKKQQAEMDKMRRLD